MSNGESIHGFTLVADKDLPEIKYLASQEKNLKAHAYEYKHVSGAKFLYLENNDPELAFTIGFKTLPKDSTGVFHILEHSVLCGSRKFPVKEPFTNLLKSSMQTFLNAMTFPDKTIYPVASTNEKDFYNLVDVYMDAVLFPNIYKNKNIFYQEGGHKTLDGFSGVVFNEMTGVYSDPQEYIFEGIMDELFCGSCYAYSSGGEPSVIKKLSYEEYLAQHNSNYRLDNAYIIVYGDLNISKMMKFLNDNYLSNSEELASWRKGVTTTSQGDWKSNFDTSKTPKTIYKKVETAKENAECGAGYVLERDHRKLVATRVLLNAIASSNESPLKKALMDEKFAADIDFDMLAEVYEPFLIVECKSLKENAGKNLLKLIADKVTEITKTGIPEELIEAAISNIEFKLKEKLPDCTNGLDYSIVALSEWLYDDNATTSAIEYIEDIKWLKSLIGTDYFDKLANEIFVDNKHVASVEVVPVEKAEVIKPNYSKDEIVEIKQTCKDLEKWQATPDSKEDIAKLPVMKKSDIGQIKQYPIPSPYEKNSQILKYDIETNGISHINRYYPINNLNLNELPYASIVSLLLGKLDTTEHDCSQIDVIIQKYFGHLDFSCAYFENIKDINEIDLRFAVRSSCLDEYSNYQYDFIDEILQKTKFDDFEKIKTILNQKKVAMEQGFIAAGHLAAMNKALATVLPIYNISDSTSGIGFYEFLKEILSNFDKNKEELTSNLCEVYKKIFSQTPTISFAGSEGVAFDGEAINNNKTRAEVSSDKDSKAYKIPSGVNYCAMVNDLRTFGDKVTGANITASKIIALEYLWNEVRVKNGAYGSGMLCNNRGTIQFYSYRDPQNVATFENFQNSTKWLQDIDIDDQTLDNFIISTVAKIDAPVSARAMMLYQDNCHFSGISHNNREAFRSQIINTTKEDIKTSAKTFEKLCTTASKCVFGGKDLDKLKDFKIIDLFS